MKKLLIPVFVVGCLQAQGSTLLFSDNFDVDGYSGSFDGASPPSPGRLSGTASGETYLQSYGAQQGIADNQAALTNAGGLRFGGQTTRYNWAGGTTGSDILAAGGFVVTFDWSYGTDSMEWIGWRIGTDNDDRGVTHGSVDHMILLRLNGDNERWDNGSNLGSSGINFGPTVNLPNTYQVTLTYLFDSFADGADVNLIAVVNGIQVVDDTFQWDGNGGELRMELATGVSGHFVDNLRIATIPEPGASLLGLLGACFLLRRHRR